MTPAPDSSTPKADVERRAFESRLEILPEATAFVEGFCARHGIGREATLRLVLIVEELVTNTVMHGHGGECDSPIALTLEPSNAGVSILYEDRARPFDPGPEMTRSHLPLPANLDRRIVGKLGLRLLGAYAERTRYAYEDGWNRVWLRARSGDVV